MHHDNVTLPKALSKIGMPRFKCPECGHRRVLIATEVVLGSVPGKKRQMTTYRTMCRKCVHATGLAKRR